MKFWKLKLFYLMIRYGQRPDQYVRLERIRELLVEKGYAKLALEHLISTPEIASMFERQILFSKEILDLNYLRNLPQGTLGRDYAFFLQKNSLTPVFFTEEMRGTDQELFYLKRVLQTHDLWHVLLGYEATAEGEIELNAFMFAQLRWPTAPVLIAGHFLQQLLENPRELPTSFATVFSGWSRGNATPPLFLIPFEEVLSLPTADVRKRFGISERSGTGKAAAESNKPYLDTMGKELWM